MIYLLLNKTYGTSDILREVLSNNISDWGGLPCKTYLVWLRNFATKRVPVH